MMLTDELLDSLFGRSMLSHSWTLFKFIEINKEKDHYILNTYEDGYFGNDFGEKLRTLTTVEDLIQVMKALTGKDYYIPEYHTP